MPRFENPPYYITAYGLAVKRGFKGTLDEWIASLKGETGDQGDKVELRYLDDKIQWRWIPDAGAVEEDTDDTTEEDSDTDEEGSEDLEDDYSWHDLIDVAEIRGEIIEQTLDIAQNAAGNAKIYAEDAATSREYAERALDGAQKAQRTAEQAQELAATSETSARQYAEEAGTAADNAAEAAAAADAAAQSAEGAVESACEKLLAMIGDLEELETDAKDSLVEAVNELLGSFGQEGGAVETVNGVPPDENGNVDVTVPDETVAEAVGAYMEENPVGPVKVAGPDTLGGVMPVEASEDMTQEVGVDGTGRLFTRPGGGEKALYERGLLSSPDGSGYDKYPVDLEHYSWLHLAGTKYMAPLVENAAMFTTEGATAHEANAAGFSSNWFLFQWVQNTAGTTTDMEDANGSCEIQGKLMFWRYGIAYSLTSQSDTFTIAKQGDAIMRTVAGDTIEASGGAGICNVAQKDDMTVYSIATYYHNGKHIPTTREISILATDYTTDPNGNFTIGAPIMWTITKDGVTYDMDDSVLGTEYGGHVNCQICCDYASAGYNYYMALVRPNKGISIITSTDCTNWTWVADIDIPVDNTAYIETALQSLGDGWYVAVRCKDGRLWVAKLLADYSINWNFFIPDCGSKPMFIRCTRTLLLACAPQSRYACRIYRFTGTTKDLAYNVYPTRLEAVADITYNACNYPFFCSSDGKPGYSTGVGVQHFLFLGTNNFVTNRLGCSYYVAKLFVNSYFKYPNEAVNALNETMKTLTFEGAVSGSYDGTENVTIKIPAGSSSDGLVWENVANETLEEEATGFTEVTLETARTVSRIRAYAEIVGTATNGENTYFMQLVVNGKNVAASTNKAVLATEDTAYVYFDIELTASGSWARGSTQTSNGNTYSSQICSCFAEDITSATEVSSILVRSQSGWGTLGVGSKLVLDIC